MVTQLLKMQSWTLSFLSSSGEDTISIMWGAGAYGECFDPSNSKPTLALEQATANHFRLVPLAFSHRLAVNDPGLFTIRCPWHDHCLSKNLGARSLSGFGVFVWIWERLYMHNEIFQG
jgi:hypothetical protein